MREKLVPDALGDYEDKVRDAEKWRRAEDLMYQQIGLREHAVATGRVSDRVRESFSNEVDLLRAILDSVKESGGE